MKRMLAALLLCGATLSTTTMSASAYELDFPNQLRAIKVCYTQWSTQHPGKAITDAQLVACKKVQGFRFDRKRQIKGVGPCHGKTARIIRTAMPNHQGRSQAEQSGKPRSDQRRMFISELRWGHYLSESVAVRSPRLPARWGLHRYQCSPGCPSVSPKRCQD